MLFPYDTLYKISKSTNQLQEQQQHQQKQQPLDARPPTVDLVLDTADCNPTPVCEHDGGVSEGGVSEIPPFCADRDD